MATKYCANCGAPLTPDSRFCDGCGTPVTAAQPPVQSAPPPPRPVYSPPPPPMTQPTRMAPAGQAYCAACGSPNAAGAAFCNVCGTRLALPAGQPVYAQPVQPAQPIQYTQPVQQVQPASGNQPTSGAWWLLPIFLTWLGGIIAWAAVKSKNKGKATGMLWLGIVLTVVYTIIWIILNVLSAGF